MSHRTDEDLIAGFQDGNPDKVGTAFNELVRRYQERVYWVARRLLGNHADADDVAQEVFIKVYHCLKDFRSESSFYTWIYRITINEALNLKRKNRLREILHLDDLVAPLATDVILPDKQLEDKQQKSLIEEAIATLPRKQRTVFILRYYENLPYEEIARIMKRSVGGMKANYFQAVKKISQYIKASE